MPQLNPAKSNKFVESITSEVQPERELLHLCYRIALSPTLGGS